MAGRKSDFTLPTNTLDELFSSQEERDEAKLSKIRDIPLEEIDDFPDHPFKVREDEDKHSKLPSFLSKTPGSAQEIELEWDGSKYTVTLTDSNNVLSGYKFSSNDSGVQFSVSGNKLTITAEKAPSDGLTITAEKTAQRKGVITWTDGIYGPNGGVQDTVGRYSCSEKRIGIPSGASTQ